jgi:hypothetical protein
LAGAELWVEELGAHGSVLGNSACHEGKDASDVFEVLLGSEDLATFTLFAPGFEIEENLPRIGEREAAVLGVEARDLLHKFSGEDLVEPGLGETRVETPSWLGVRRSRAEHDGQGNGGGEERGVETLHGSRLL